MSVRASQFEAEVLRREELSAHLVRIVLATPEGWASTGVPDEWVSLTVPGQFQTRYYTVRSCSAEELVLDVVVHDEGLVTEWAQGGCVGDVVGISEPKGSFTLPADAGWVHLVGDLTALPAMERIAVTVGDSLPVTIWAEADPVEGYFSRPVTWVDPGGAGLAALVESLEWPAGPGYFWMAGESGQMRDIRRFVRRSLGWDAAHHDLMGYWSQSRGRQRRAVDPGPIYARGKAAGKSDEEIWAEYDEERNRD